jgi:D-alanyl-D-alanine carboxypeptidase
MSATALAERIDSIVTDLPATGGVCGAIARVEVPQAGFAHAAAGGHARDGEPLGVAHRFHVASVGKMFTAALVLRVAEAGGFGPDGIDATLGALSATPPGLVGRVHPAGPAITIRHLLTHTSGMKDIQLDDATGTAASLGRPAPDSVLANFWRSAKRIAAGDRSDTFAMHRWVPWDPASPDDPMGGMLNRFLATGTAAVPVGAPGERFHYSDTGFVLLALLVEQATGRTLAELQRDQICHPLGLDATTLAYHEVGGHDRGGSTVTLGPAPCDRSGMMDFWLGDIGVLGLGLDVSWDWGGGGQISTAADLCRFLRGLLAGELFDDPVTIGEMTRWSHPLGCPPERPGVGLGLFRWRAGAHTLIGHAGAWGVRVFHDPVSGAFVAGTVGRRHDCAWLAHLIDAVHQELS